MPETLKKDPMEKTSENPGARFILFLAKRDLPQFGFVLALCMASTALAQDVKKSEVYIRLRATIDAVPAVDIHSHLQSFDGVLQRHLEMGNPTMGLRALWTASYLSRIHQTPSWSSNESFDDWYRNFDDVRATSVYRYLLPAFTDLYEVDFDSGLTSAQACELDRRIVANYRSDAWIRDVVTKRANIHIMFVDPNWAPFLFATNWDFEARVMRIDPLMDAHHPSVPKGPFDDPYAFAVKAGMKIQSLDEYLSLADRIFADAKAAGVIGIKSGAAYRGGLHFRNVPKENAEAAFGKPRDQISSTQYQDFYDFMMWRLCELSTKHDLPFQIHTGDARLQQSNPTLLLDMIEANPRTKFILMHGGHPWIGETGAIAFKHRNVWVDSCWLPTLNYSAGKRAYQEWLECMPSDRIMWGSDSINAEGTYAATVTTRQCLAEALAEKVLRGELREEHAHRIGRQIMRDNALKLFPSLQRRVTNR